MKFSVPNLTTEQMVEVDRAMLEDFHIELIQMMENAGRNLAHVARDRFFDGDPSGRSVVVLAGSGSNGGGALAAARRLHNWGALVRVVLTRGPDSLVGLPRHQLDILRRIGVPIGTGEEWDNDDDATELIVDGVIGYSLRGAPHGTAAALIDSTNRLARPVLSLDVPSGLDSTTGRVHEQTIRATATMTLALPKVGLMAPEAADHVGEIYLADIGVPPGLYAEPPLGLEVGPIFALEDVVRLR